jgi:NAD(P)-dependent dehydrogenase (short-subunit alcohol dehydrogenase family)
MKAKVAAITGGSGVLGKAFAQGLAEQGVHVYILNRNETDAMLIKDEFASKNLQLSTIACDVLDEESVQKAVAEIIEKSGKIDILINCAGGNKPGATVMPEQSVTDIRIEDFKKVNDLNLLGTVIPTVAFSKPMIKQGEGCIINISSMASYTPLTRVVAYSASKAAINNFTQWMAVELANKCGGGIRVNAIAPGFFVAKQNRALLLNEDDTLTARGETIISQTPMKRFGEPEDLVSTLLWLCDEKSSFITGVIIPVDGGFSAFSGV